MEFGVYTINQVRKIVKEIYMVMPSQGKKECFVLFIGEDKDYGMLRKYGARVLDDGS